MIKIISRWIWAVNLIFTQRTIELLMVHAQFNKEFSLIKWKQVDISQHLILVQEKENKQKASF